MNHKFSKQEQSNLESYLSSSDITILSLHKDPYWLIKAYCIEKKLDFIGSYRELAVRLQTHLFFSNETSKKIPNEKYLSISSEDPFSKLYDSQLPSSLSHYESKGLLPIYQYIPEIKKINKELAYSELYSSLTILTDPHLVFVNVFKPDAFENFISAVCYFPYVPEDLDNLSNADLELFVSKLSKITSLHSEYSTTNIPNSEINEKTEFQVKILKQKLIDLYNLANDSDDLHAVTFCHNPSKQCAYFSSSYCENNLCKICCQSLPNLDFCPLHHTKSNYYRYSLQKLFEYEQGNFDSKRTIKVTYKDSSVSNFMNLSKLKEIFSSYDFIEWSNTKVYFQPKTGRIEHVYLICSSNQEANKIYDDRVKLMSLWAKQSYEFHISHLSESFQSILNSRNDLEHAGLLVFPLESSSSAFPKKAERLKTFHKLITSVLSITEDDFSIVNCKNDINNDLSYNYFIVKFNKRDDLDRFYLLQPFYDSVVFHKFIHLTYFPLLRQIPRNSERINCISCSKRKNPECKYDLCEECCANSVNKENSKSKLSSLIIEKFGKCSNCKGFCESNTVKALNEEVSIKPFFINKIINEDLSEVKNLIEIRKKIFILNFIESIKNSNFNFFFRQVSCTSKTRLMLDMNKELAVVMDNPNYKRESVMKVNDRMYKCFTFQHNKLDHSSYSVPVSSAFDLKGDFFIDFDFSKGSRKERIDHFVPVNWENTSSLDLSSFKEVEALSKSDFHLFVYGLDIVSLTNQEVIDDIYADFKIKGIKVYKENINIVNENALLNYALQNKLFKNIDDLKNKINEIGRIATVRFNENSEALRVYLGKIKLNFPLLNNYKGHPLMLPGSLLQEYLNSLN